MPATSQQKAVLDIALLIDKHRQSHSHLQNYLNQFASREALEAEFVEFYQRSGIENVPAEVIRAGIEEYESRRFLPASFKGGWFAKSFVTGYLNVFRNMSTYALSVLALVLIMVVSSIAVKAQRDGAVADLTALQNKAFHHQETAKALSIQIERMEGDLNSLPINSLTMSKGPADEKRGVVLLELNTAQVSLQDVQRKSLPPFESGDQLSTAQIREKIISWQDSYVSPMEAELQKAQKTIRDAEKLINTVGKITVAEAFFAQVSTGEAMGDAKVMAEVNAMALAINRFDLEAYEYAKTRYNAALGGYAKRQELTAALDRRMEIIKPDFIGETAKARLSDFHKMASDAISIVSVNSFEKAMKDINILHAYVSRNLTINIMSSPETGFSRTNEEGKKRYYLVLEAVDSNGQQVQRYIRNSENGRIELVKRWAQNVPEAEFQKVVADKKPDGLVDDNLFGVKKSGYYDIDYKRPQLNISITRW